MAGAEPVAGDAGRDSDGATTGYEAELWAMADALRGSMDAAEYKHVVLGLIFLKYISDAFEERHAALLDEWGEEAAEDRDEYTAENIFWAPPEARWAGLKARARQATVGWLVDDAMAAIERDNPALRDVLPRDYARHDLLHGGMTVRTSFMRKGSSALCRRRPSAGRPGGLPSALRMAEAVSEAADRQAAGAAVVVVGVCHGDRQ